MANMFTPNCCCGGCDDEVLTFSAQKPTTELVTVNATMTRATASRTTYIWQVAGPTGNPPRSFAQSGLNGVDTTRHRRAAIYFTLSESALVNASSVTLSFTIVNVLQTVLVPPGPRKVEITAPRPASALPITKAEMDTIIDGAPTQIAEAELAGAFGVTKTIDITSLVTDAFDDFDSPTWLIGILGPNPSEPNGGVVFHTIRVTVNYPDDPPLVITPTARTFEQRAERWIFSTQSNGAIDANFRNITGSTIATEEQWTAVRYAFPGTSGNLANPISATITSAGTPTLFDSSAGNQFLLRGAIQNGNLPTSYESLLSTWEGLSPSEIVPYGTPIPVSWNRNALPFFSGLTENPASIVLFFGPRPDRLTNHGIGNLNTAMNAQARIDVFAPIVDGVEYDSENDRWILTKSLPNEFWTTLITPCNITAATNPYKHRWRVRYWELPESGTYRDIENCIYEVEWTRQQYVAGSVTDGFVQWIDDRANHVAVKYGNPSDVNYPFNAVIGSISNLDMLGVQTPLRVTSRPSGTLNTFEAIGDGGLGSFSFDGGWTGSPANYRNGISMRTAFQPPIATSRPIIITLESNSVDPIHNTLKTITSGNWTVARSKIPDDEGRNDQCIKPVVCSIKTPDYMTPRWAITANWGEAGAGQHGYSLCRTSRGSLTTDLKVSDPGIIFGVLFEESSENLVEWTAVESFNPPRILRAIGKEYSKYFTGPGSEVEFDRAIILQADAAVVDSNATHFLVRATTGCSIVTDDFPALPLSTSQLPPVPPMYVSGNANLPPLFPEVVHMEGIQRMPDNLGATAIPFFTLPGDVQAQYPFAAGSDRFVPFRPRGDIGFKTVEYSVVWERWVPKWEGPPPSLVFRGDDEDATVTVKTYTFNVEDTVPTVSPSDTVNAVIGAKFDVEGVPFTRDVYERLNDGSNVYQGQITSTYAQHLPVEWIDPQPFSAASIEITLAPASDSMPHPPEAAP